MAMDEDIQEFSAESAQQQSPGWRPAEASAKAGRNPGSGKNHNKPCKGGTGFSFMQTCFALTGLGFVPVISQGSASLHPGLCCFVPSALMLSLTRMSYRWSRYLSNRGISIAIVPRSP